MSLYKVVIWSLYIFAEPHAVKAIRNAATSVCSLSMTEFDLRFNPDIFSPNVKHASPPEEERTDEEEKSGEHEKQNAETDKSNEDENSQNKEVSKKKKYPALEAQVRLNREACDFLLLFQIPCFIRDIAANR